MLHDLNFHASLQSAALTEEDMDDQDEPDDIAVDDLDFSDVASAIRNDLDWFVDTYMAFIVVNKPEDQDFSGESEDEDSDDLK